MAALLFPEIEITWGRKHLNAAPSPTPVAARGPKAESAAAAPPTEKKKKGALRCASEAVGKGTCTALKKTTFIWPIKALLGLLDIMAAPFGNMAGKELNYPILWKVGCGLILGSFWLYIAVDANVPKLLQETGLRPGNILLLSTIAKTLFPGILALGGASMIVGGMRLQQAKSFMQKYGGALEPLPAFESGVIFKIGDLKLSLRDMHTGVGAFGGIGSGKVQKWLSVVNVRGKGAVQADMVQVEDLVLGPHGYRKVLKVIPYKNHPFWWVKTKSGKRTSVGADHLWWHRLEGEEGEAISETQVLRKLLKSKAILLPVMENGVMTWEELKSITFDEISWGKCFVLEGTEHLYIADGIVTHNCLDPDQDILMFDGSIKKVKDVLQGELLMGPDGTARRILQTSTGYGPLYRIIPIKGAGKPWICNDAHVMTLRYTNQGGSRPARKTPAGIEEKDHYDRRKHYKGISQIFGEIPNKKMGRYYQRVLEDNNFVMDVPLKDFIARKAPSRDLDLFWKLFRPEGIEFPDLEEDDPSRYNYTHAALSLEEFYLAGAWVGDGCLRMAAWCNQDQIVLESVRNYAKGDKRELSESEIPSNERFRILGLKGAGPKSALENYLLEFTSASPDQKASCGGSLSGLYKRHGGGYDKDIPHWALVAPREKRLELLAGLLDTDGHLQIEGRCFDFVQKRKHLVEKTVWLCRSLGLAAAEPYEAWKECTNRKQTLPSVEELKTHPALLQQLADRATLKLDLRVKEGKVGQEEERHIRLVLAQIKGEAPAAAENLDGSLRYRTVQKRDKQKTTRLIEMVKTAYIATVGKSPRREVIWKYLADNEEFATLMEDFRRKCETSEIPETEQEWQSWDAWTKSMVQIQARRELFPEEPLGFDEENVMTLLEFHRSEPRERYWRTTISGAIEIIPTRIPRKQVTSCRPEKRADGRGLVGIDDRNSKDPLCFGWDAEPIGEGPYCGFTLDGDGRFLLGDFTVTHNTVSMMVPLMRQFFRQLRDADDESEYAKCGALILDEKGDFIDSTITEMRLAGRSLQDLVIIDPDLDLYRYNPLDPGQSADENAAKLAKVQKILGNSSGGDNAYWDQTSQVTIKCFLQLLEVYKPKHKIGMDDIARFMRDDGLATILCDTVEKIIEEKKANNDISEDAYGTYTDAISSTRNGWIQLHQNTKSTLKTTITNMLGPIAQNPKLQKVFCRDTNFSFRDLPNLGKVVLFRGSGVDKATARLICVCLKIDFQTWQKRRNGSAAAAHGLNTMRTVVFICDEYQEFVTCGGEGDETFYGVSRSTRTAPIVATQSYNSLETAIKNKEQTKTLRQNIATWVFFRSTDQDTCELGKFLAGQSKKEDFSTSVNTDGFLQSAADLGQQSGKQNSVNVSKKLEENFRTDDFSRLVTMTMEKSRTGPWYSEAIVYHYHDIDESAESRCYKTRLSHLYYDTKLRKQASANVKHLDWVLCDRNWQRKALQRGLLLIQTATAEMKEIKNKDIMRRGTVAALEAEKRKAEESPEMASQKKVVEDLLTKTKAETANAEKHLKGAGMPGEINTSEPEVNKEEIEARLERLKEDLNNADDEKEMQRIAIEIEQEKMTLSRLVISERCRGNVDRKEVLRANALPGEDPDDPQEGDPGLMMVTQTPEEDEEDALWNEVITETAEITGVASSEIELEAITNTQREDARKKEESGATAEGVSSTAAILAGALAASAAAQAATETPPTTTTPATPQSAENQDPGADDGSDPSIPTGEEPEAPKTPDAPENPEAKVEETAEASDNTDPELESGMAADDPPDADAYGGGWDVDDENA